MFSFLRDRIYLQALLLIATGIYLGGRFVLPLGAAEAMMLPALLAGGCLLALHLLWRGSTSWFSMLPAALALLLAGYFLCSISISQVTGAPLLEHCGAGEVEATARVSSLPKYQRGHLRFLATVTSIDGDDQAGPLGSCQFYLQCEPGFRLSPGDSFSFSGEPEEVDPPRNRGQFDYRAYLMQRGTVVTCYLPSPAFMEVTDDSGSRRLAWLAALRGRLTDNLTRNLPDDLQELALSVVYGDKITDLDEELQERFRRAGLTHILVASGTQVSLLVVLMAMAMWRSPRRFDARGTALSVLQFAVTIGVVAVYAGITGFETSIVRALCMGFLLCAGRLFLRRVDGLSTLAQAGVVLLLAQPLQLFTPGFQLSFLATFGLIYMMGSLHPLVADIGGWRRYLLDGLLTTGGAQLFVTPVLAASFNQFSLVGLLSNLLAVPLSLVLLICGALSSFGLNAVPGIGHVLGWLVHWFSLMLDSLATFFAGLPFSSIAVASPQGWVIACFYLLVLLAGEWFRNREQLDGRTLALLQPASALSGLLVFSWIAVRAILPHPELSLIRLERSFAVIQQRPGSGSTLVVNPYWLTRRHNADNLHSSLKARGLAEVDRILWISGVPEDNPLKEISAEQLELSKQTASAAGMQLLVTDSGDAAGVAGLLAGKPVVVSWNEPEELPAGLSVLVRVEPQDEDALGGIGQYWASVDELEGDQEGGWLRSDAEICIEPAPGDRLRSFTLLR